MAEVKSINGYMLKDEESRRLIDTLTDRTTEAEEKIDLLEGVSSTQTDDIAKLKTDVSGLDANGLGYHGAINASDDVLTLKRGIYTTGNYENTDYGIVKYSFLYKPSSDTFSGAFMIRHTNTRSSAGLYIYQTQSNMFERIDRALKTTITKTTGTTGNIATGAMLDTLRIMDTRCKGYIAFPFLSDSNEWFIKVVNQTDLSPASGVEVTIDYYYELM